MAYTKPQKSTKQTQTTKQKQNVSNVRKLWMLLALSSLICINSSRPWLMDLQRTLSQARLVTHAPTTRTSTSTGSHTPGSTLAKERVPNHENQRIVFLPGPHKTGTSSVQHVMSLWLANPTLNKPGIPPFHQCAFPVPEPKQVKAALQSIGQPTFLHESGGKAFRALGRMLQNISMDQEISQNPVVQLYMESIQTAWDQGYNIVVAAEFFDYLAVETNNGVLMSPNAIWERLLDSFPSRPGPDNMLVAVQHRSPRIDHLVSVWHQLGRKPQRTLLEFVTGPILQESQFYLNSLGLADFFVQKGFPVSILDVQGLTDQGVSLSVAISCHVLEVPCDYFATNSGDQRLQIVAERNETGTYPFTKRSNQHRNSRQDTGERAMDAETLTQMERILKLHDCQYQHFADRKEKEQIRLLYGDNIFAECPPHDPFQPKQPFTETVQALVSLACQRYPNATTCVL